MRLLSITRIVGLWAILFCVGSKAGAAEFAGGTGEPNDPYLIATAEQLLATNFTVPEVYYQLIDDIDMIGRPLQDAYLWPHLGDDGFQAHLDGAGFEIRNMVCYPTGVFGCVMPGATLSNLVLSHVELVAVVDPEEQALYWLPVGALASENYGTISNCGVTGLIVAWRATNVGGAVGANSGTMVNCFFDGWVIAMWEYLIPGDDRIPPYVGGLVSLNRQDGVISNSVSRGTVLADMGAGGLVGLNRGVIRNGYSQCAVLGRVGAGGLVSENAGALHTCYAANRVTGELRGGLVGLAGEHFGNVSHCVWDSSDTEYQRSGAGVRVPSLARKYLAFNGWAEDPNWVIPTDPCMADYYPRLAWEMEGETIPKYVHPYFEEDGGTEVDPYLIGTPEALIALGEASIFWDRHFVLANDLDMQGLGLSIGICGGSEFSGTFEGDGYVIRNLGWGSSSDSDPLWNGGLFGYMTGAVRGLVLEDCKLWGGMNSRRIGLLAGTNAGAVENCFVSGSIEVGEFSTLAGELIGYNRGTVSNCDSSATVVAGEGSTKIGGLIGGEGPR